VALVFEADAEDGASEEDAAVVGPAAGPGVEGLEGELFELLGDEEDEDVGELAGLAADGDAEAASEEEGEEVGSLDLGVALVVGGAAEGDVGGDDEGDFAGRLDADEGRLGRGQVGASLFAGEGAGGVDALPGGGEAGIFGGEGSLSGSVEEGCDAVAEEVSVDAPFVEGDGGDGAALEEGGEDIASGPFDAELPGVGACADADDASGAGPRGEVGGGVGELAEEGVGFDFGQGLEEAVEVLGGGSWDSGGGDRRRGFSSSSSSSGEAGRLWGRVRRVSCAAAGFEQELE
jgi:hypothetical protein